MRRAARGEFPLPDNGITGIVNRNKPCVLEEEGDKVVEKRGWKDMQRDVNESKT